MIIDENFRIVKDTYDLDRGKTMVSQEVIDSYNGKDTSRYDSKSSYIEMTIRIQDKETKETLGVMLMSVSTDEIQANMNILEQKVTLKSSLKENQIAELEQLAEAIVASMK